MKIRFVLGWVDTKPTQRHFKSKECAALFSDYTSRIEHFCSFQTEGLSQLSKEKQGKFWFCHTSKASKQLSSEELAQLIEKMQNQGVKEWTIAIGPADGFKEKHIQNSKPDFLWSFGPLTLPHELAAVVATEQIYRAYSILKNLPYHSAH